MNIKLQLTRKKPYTSMSISLNACTNYEVDGDNLFIGYYDGELSVSAYEFLFFETENVNSAINVLKSACNVDKVYYEDMEMTVEEAIDFFTKMKKT